MTARITFSRIGAHQLRVNATVDIQVTGLDEIWPHLLPGDTAARVRIGESSQGSDSQHLLTVEERSVGDSKDPGSRRNHQELASVSSHIDAATEAVSEYIGAWEPESALDLDSFLAGLPRLFDTLAAAVSGVAERLTAEYPIHPSVPEHLEEIAATVAGMSEFAAEAHAIHLGGPRGGDGAH